jgi:hypothetical protein
MYSATGHAFACRANLADARLVVDLPVRQTVRQLAGHSALSPAELTRRPLR